MAALVALGGRLGDRFGGVTTFRIGVLIFFLASVGCGLAPAGELGEPVIIACRTLQGAGAALMMPVSASIVIAAFPASERGRAMAIYAGISQIFLAIGPLLGGFLTQTLSWRAVFWLNVPVGIAALILVQIARPANVRTPGGPIRPDHVAMLVLGVGLTVLAIQEASRWTWTSPLTWSVLSVGLVLAALFVRAQLRSDSPLVNVRLLERRPFLADNVVMGLVQFGLLPVVLFNSLYVQDILGFSPIRPARHLAGDLARHGGGADRRSLVRPLRRPAPGADRAERLHRRPAVLDGGAPDADLFVAGAGHDLDRLRSRPDHLTDQHRRAEPGHSGGAGPGLRTGADHPPTRRHGRAWPW